jgi:hypothetical protein
LLRVWERGGEGLAIGAVNCAATFESTRQTSLKYTVK